MNYQTFSEYILNEANQGIRLIIKQELFKNKRRYADHSIKTRIFMKSGTIYDALNDITNACVNLGLDITDELHVIDGGEYSDRANKVYVQNYKTIEGGIDDQEFYLTISEVDKSRPSTEQQELCSLVVFKKFIEEGYNSVAEIVQDLKKVWTKVDSQSDWLNSFQQQGSTLKHFLGDVKGYEYFRNEKFADQIYTIAKKLTGLRQIDTWNPADVWMVKNPKDHIKVIKSFGSVDQLNSYLVDKIKTKDIIPISLKKTRGSASLQQINMDSGYGDTDILKIDCDLYWDDETDKFSQAGATISMIDSSVLTLRFSSKTTYAIEGSNKKNSAAQLGKTPTFIWKKLLNSDADIKKYNGPDKDEPILRRYFDALVREPVIDCRTNDWERFMRGMRVAWDNKRTRSNVYLQKIVTMELIYNLIKNNKERRKEIINKFIKSSQKIGDDYGPFIKIY